MKAREARARPLLTLGLAGDQAWASRPDQWGEGWKGDSVPSQAAVGGICSAWVCPGGAGGRGCEYGEKALGLLTQKDRGRSGEDCCPDDGGGVYKLIPCVQALSRR